MKIIDITKKIDKDCLFYGQELPKKEFEKSINNGDKCNISTISELNMHLGTHVDFPFHMIKDGNKGNDYNNDKFYGNCYLVDLSYSINLIDRLSEIDLDGLILLIKGPSNTGDNYFYLNKNEIDFIISKGIKNIGINMPSIDGYGKTTFPNHKKLFGKDILIYEGLELNNAKEGFYYFFGLPIIFNGLEAGLTRAFLIKK